MPDENRDDDGGDDDDDGDDNDGDDDNEGVDWEENCLLYNSSSSSSSFASLVDLSSTLFWRYTTAWKHV